VFTTLGPLTLGLLFAGSHPAAHAITITVVGTSGVDGAPNTDGGPGGAATAITPPNSDPADTANATGGAGGAGGSSNIARTTGGVGGNAAATAATSTAATATTGFATATATGGTGGAAGFGSFGFSFGGSGGNATSNAIVINTPTHQSPPLPLEEAAALVALPLAAMEVVQTPKQAVSLARTLRSLPPQEVETVVSAAVRAALPPYRAAALVRQLLAVR
jgi:hypothetical protein